jgi:hypothetical protein
VGVECGFFVAIVVVVRVSANGCVVRQDFRYMVIKADETENCNLLEVLEHALKFMQDGLKNGKVLVHWYHRITLIVFNECKQLIVDGP